MRMRLKSNLQKRFDLCKNSLIKVDKTERNAKIANERKDYIDLVAIFGNDNPIYLDLGCGKGSFAIELAKRNPNVNVIAIEMITNVILDGLERVKDDEIANLKFMNTGADYLPKYFRQGCIERIFLNFSTPKQKKSYANSRLTCPRFLDIYKLLLNENGEIHQKTDDGDFFEYSLKSFKENGFDLLYHTYDLHENFDENNIVTEYEKQFIQLGKKIKKLIAKVK